MELSINILGIVDIRIQSEQDLNISKEDLNNCKNSESDKLYRSVNETKDIVKTAKSSKRRAIKKVPRKLSHNTDTWGFTYVSEPKKPRNAPTYRNEEFNTPYKFPISWIDITNNKVADRESFTRRDVIGAETTGSNAEAISRYELWLKSNGYDINRGTAPDGTKNCIYYTPKDAVLA